MSTDYIYSLDVFIENPCSKRIVDYVPITTSRPCDVTDAKINHGCLNYNLIGRRRFIAVSRRTACKCFTASTLAFLEDFSSKFGLNHK